MSQEFNGNKWEFKNIHPNEMTIEMETICVALKVNVRYDNYIIDIFSYLILQAQPNAITSCFHILEM